MSTTAKHFKGVSSTTLQNVYRVTLQAFQLTQAVCYKATRLMQTCDISFRLKLPDDEISKSKHGNDFMRVELKWRVEKYPEGFRKNPFPTRPIIKH